MKNVFEFGGFDSPGLDYHRPSEDKGAGFLSSFWTKPIIFDDGDV